MTDLLGRTLTEDCVDPATGELVPLIVVTDSGACFKAAEFARHLRSRPELRHVRTRVKSPETNGQIERFFGAIKYEHLYRHDIADGQDLAEHVDRYLDVYNAVRPHEALPSAGRSTPTSPHSQRARTSRFPDAGHRIFIPLQRAQAPQLTRRPTTDQPRSQPRWAGQLVR